MPSSDVIWQCKDYADGWISFPSEREAATYQAATGCAVRTVPHPAMPIEELRKAIGSAIFDPGVTEGYKGDRTLTEWQLDAVMRVLAPHPTPTAADTPAAQIAFDQQSDDPQPGTWNDACVHVATLLRQSVAADTGLVERLTAERDKWEETAKYSEKRVAVWQAKEAAAHEQIAALERKLEAAEEKANDVAAAWARDAELEAAEASLSAAQETISRMREMCLRAADIFDANDFGHDLRFELRDIGETNDGQ